MLEYRQLRRFDRPRGQAVAAKQQDQEYALPIAGHVQDSTSDGAVELGAGDFKYRVSGDNWGVLPDGWVYREATAVAVDQQDRIYVFNRRRKGMLDNLPLDVQEKVAKSAPRHRPFVVRG